jgi:hypothetical protein
MSALCVWLKREYLTSLAISSCSENSPCVPLKIYSAKHCNVTVLVMSCDSVPLRFSVLKIYFETAK